MGFSPDRTRGEVRTKALDLDIVNYFEPTAENYFNHLTRDGIKAALTEIKEREFASGIARRKKAEAANLCRDAGQGHSFVVSALRPILAEGHEGDGTSPEADLGQRRRCNRNNR